MLANLAPLIEESAPATAQEYYDDAIEHQEWSVQRSPSIQEFRLWLSSSYVKYGRFLRAQGSYASAGNVAMKRRDLWSDDPERLYLVALEMAKAAEGIDRSQRETKRRWEDQTLAILKNAIALGLSDVETKSKDPALKSVIEYSDQSKRDER